MSRKDRIRLVKIFNNFLIVIVTTLVVGAMIAIISEADSMKIKILVFILGFIMLGIAKLLMNLHENINKVLKNIKKEIV